MDIGMELKKLCEETIEALYILKSKGLITEVEMEAQILEKERCIENLSEKTNIAPI